MKIKWLHFLSHSNSKLENDKCKCMFDIKQVQRGGDWHSMDVASVLDFFNVDPVQGLSEIEVKERQRHCGLNRLIVYKPQNIFVRFLRQFNNVLIYILLLSAIITIILARFVDMSVILGVIVLNALVGFIQEGKAENALIAIRNMLAPMAKVVREGKRTVISANLLTLGDIVIVERGDKIPADLRLLEARELQIQEAVLTGESLPVEKSPLTLDKNAPIAERFSMAYSGTMVMNGRGLGVVVATGIKTEIGKISESLSTIEAPVTPLLTQMNRFGYWLTAAILLLGAATFMFGALVLHDTSHEMFMAIVGLIVAAVPEGLPPILTIILALGVTRMAKRHAIIQRLPAVETMGAVTTICSDKTGTLTCNELAVANLVTARNDYNVAADQIYIDKNEEIYKMHCDEHPDLRKALVAGVLCNDAELSVVGGKRELYGDPLDLALLSLAGKVKANLILLKKSNPRTDLIPYESEHKLMATMHHDHGLGKFFVYVKGAPERILSMCVAQQLNGKVEPIKIDYWQEKIEQLAHKGEKVLAIAYREVERGKQALRFADIEKLTMVALFGFIDPPSKDVQEAVAKCHAAGIKVKMITGDHALTAHAIAKSIGIVNGDDQDTHVLTGPDIDAKDDQELAKEVLDVDVYARTSPNHKLRLVKALQANDQVVAMTGDGVNDAPALRQADIGVAMGKRGTEIAKEAADMVLADDHFTSIVHAVEEGRIIYENLKKAIMYVLPSSIAQAGTILVAIFLHLQLPITPVQILWVNMVIAVTLTLALGFEPAVPGLMQRLPRQKNTPILSAFLVWRVIFVSFLFVVAVFVVAFISSKVTGDIAKVHAVAVNMIVAGEIVYLLNCRRIYISALNFDTLFGSVPALIAIGIVIVAQAAFTYVPIMQRFFGVAAIGLRQWTCISVFAIVIFLLIEMEKMGFRLKKQRA